MNRKISRKIFDFLLPKENEKEQKGTKENLPKKNEKEQKRTRERDCRKRTKKNEKESLPKKNEKERKNIFVLFRPLSAFPKFSFSFFFGLFRHSQNSLFRSFSVSFGNPKILFFALFRSFSVIPKFSFSLFFGLFRQSQNSLFRSFSLFFGNPKILFFALFRPLSAIPKFSFSLFFGLFRRASFLALAATAAAQSPTLSFRIEPAMPVYFVGQQATAILTVDADGFELYGETRLSAFSSPADTFYLGKFTQRKDQNTRLSIYTAPIVFTTESEIVFAPAIEGQIAVSEMRGIFMNRKVTGFTASAPPLSVKVRTLPQIGRAHV